jgi:hypothetical protein
MHRLSRRAGALLLLRLWALRHLQAIFMRRRGLELGAERKRYTVRRLRRRGSVRGGTPQAIFVRGTPPTRTKWRGLGNTQISLKNLLTKFYMSDIIKTEKGKTLNGYVLC